MITLNKTEVPSEIEGAKRVNGVIVAYTASEERVLLLGHETHRVTTTDEQGKEKTEKKDYAFEVRVRMPATRARAITAAEMTAYGLVDSYDLASFNAGLARKQREGVDKKEIKEHDEFIAWVKDELSKIGI